jgi:uncharacterized protein (TIGR02246 family)
MGGGGIQWRCFVTNSNSTADRSAINAIVAGLEAAWNAGDGGRFGAPFAADADFVTIRAEHLRGREAIANGHAAIFRTIYAGSVNRFTIESLRFLRPDLALVHVDAALDAPVGPLAGKHTAKFSAVLTREPGGWQIASFHNTLAAPSAGTAT